LLLKVTTNPPDGAGPLSVTVPAEAIPPPTVAGLRVRPVSDGAEMVSVVDTEVDETLAVIVATVCAATGNVDILKVAVAAPAGTVTAVGTVAAAWLLFKATVRPPAGAATLRATVAREVVPPTKVEGLTVKEEIGSGSTLSVEL